MLAEDFDGDGNLDLLAVGNDYGTETSVGRYDACNCLYLKGDGKGNFFKTPMLQSGWFVPGNAKALVKLRNGQGNLLLAATQNRGPLKVAAVKKNVKQVPLLPNDVPAMIILANQQAQRQEFTYGASFLSQSARFITVPSGARRVVIQNSKGAQRTVNF